jgi:spore coat polysaccharide biosynthesis predicted glycosyltransferase SpsG
MAAMMSVADLSIGAPSSASWERACLGLPAVVIILAENQVRVAHALEEHGAVVNIGWHHDVSSEAITAAIAELQASPDRLAEMSRRAGELTDGHGSARVAAVIERR